MSTPVTVETLTPEAIALWFDSTEKHFRHQLTMWDALGSPAGPCYRQPTAEETAEARRRICDAINARNGAKP